MRITETCGFVSPDKTQWRVIYLGPRWLQITFGSAEYVGGAVQGYIQVVIWKISMQISVKWLS